MLQNESRYGRLVFGQALNREGLMYGVCMKETDDEVIIVRPKNKFDALKPTCTVIQDEQMTAKQSKFYKEFMNENPAIQRELQENK